MAKRQSKGLGDTVEKVFQSVGIDKLVKFVSGEDCNCEERKEKLNALFPYGRKKAECLTENEYEILNGFFSEVREQISPIEQQALLRINNRAFNDTQEPTNCDSCWRDIVANLKKLYETY